VDQVKVKKKKNNIHLIKLVFTYNTCHLERFFVLKIIRVGNLPGFPDTLQYINQFGISFTATEYCQRQTTYTKKNLSDLALFILFQMSAVTVRYEEQDPSSVLTAV